MPVASPLADLFMLHSAAKFRRSLQIQRPGLAARVKSRHAGAVFRSVGAFFAFAVLCYGGCAGGTFGCAGFLDSWSANPRTVATLSDRINGDQVLVRDLTRVLAIPLRDGCDLLDVLGRRLQATVCHS